MSRPNDVAAQPGNAKPHLLVCAYAFSPLLGSEFAQGWNYVHQMAERYRLTVLVGSSDGRMGDFEQLGHSAVAALPCDVTIRPVGMDRMCAVIKTLDVRYGLSWLFVFGLRRWHWLAYQEAARIHQDDAVVAAHQLGPVGFRNPGYLHRLNAPTYWGPIGGFQYIDLALAFRSSPRYGLTSLVRNVLTFVSGRSRYVRQAIRGFDRLSFATLTNRDNFAKVYGQVDGPILSDQAADKPLASVVADQSALTALTVVWCGTVDARKNIRLLVDIAERVQARGFACEFKVIGSGSMLQSAKALSADKRLRNIEFLGQIPREEVRAVMRWSDVVCFTSLSEANTSTLFEALGEVCIPISLDLDGFSTNISDQIGFKVNARQPWDAIVDQYADHLESLARNPKLRTDLVDMIVRDFETYSWRTLAARHAEIISGMIAVAS